LDPTRKIEYRQKLLELIPPGDSKGNSTLREQLRRAIEAAGDHVTDEDYWTLRDSLIEEGLIETGRGRGGSVHRVARDSANGPQVRTPPISVLESELYEPFLTAIKSGYAPSNRIKRFIIEATAMQGRRATGGKWTRPDISLIAMRTYSFVPGKHLEIITFEIKPSVDTALEGIFEALAHSVFAHRSFLAVCTRDPEDRDDDRVYQECKRLGVGYITFSDSGDYDTFDTVVSAPLKAPDPYEIDNFIKTQIAPHNQEEIREWLR
jgi:hypothetical protein